MNAWYYVDCPPGLRRLHARLMQALAPYLEKRAPRSEMFWARRPVSRSTRGWVRHFADAAYGRYRPHITLGSGRPRPEDDLPRAFLARRLAVYQLGDHCTCARPLFEARLRGR